MTDVPKSPMRVKIACDILVPDVFYAVTHKKVGVLAMFAERTHAETFFEQTAGDDGGWKIEAIELP